MCMKYRAICFDFDYTLGDSTDSIVAGFQYGFTRLGWPAPDQLLRELKARGIGLGIVSTKRSDTLEAILENRGVLGELDLIIGSDRVKRHKPDPEGLLAAMSRLGAGPEETLFCGDTVLDAGAAQNAGTEFAAVLNGTTPASAFREWPHVHIAPDLWDLKRWLEEQ